MKDNIVIVECENLGKTTIANAFKNQIEKQQLELKQIAYKIEQRPEIDVYYKKEFVCKGIHQYKQQQKNEGNIIKSTWVCQCGRVLQ